MKRGQIVWAKLDGSGSGSVQRGIRPCIVVQNNTGNRYSPTTIIVPLTGRKISKLLPTHLSLSEEDLSFKFERSTALCEQVMVIDKRVVLNTTDIYLPSKVIENLNKKLAISIGVKIEGREMA